MEYMVGVFLAAGVSLLATLSGLDRARSFYPFLMMVIASYYALFAIMGDSGRALSLESIFIVAFIVVSIIGFKLNLWVVVGALFAHGIYDLFHGHLISNPGVPKWWPGFCLTYDTTAAAYLAWMLRRSKPAKAVP